MLKFKSERKAEKVISVILAVMMVMSALPLTVLNVGAASDWELVGSITTSPENPYTTPDSGLYSTSATATENNCYTITRSGDVYTVVNTSGKYMNISAAGAVTWTDSAQAITLKSDANSNITAYNASGVAATSAINGVPFYSATAEEKTRTSSGNVYSLDTDGVDFGTDNAYLIVGATDNYIFTNDGSTVTAAAVTVTGNTITYPDTDHDWYITTATSGNTIGNGSYFITTPATDGAVISLQTSSRQWLTVSAANQASGLYYIYYTYSSYNRFCYYNNGWVMHRESSSVTAPGTAYAVRLYKLTSENSNGTVTYTEYTSGTQFTTSVTPDTVVYHYVRYSGSEVEVPYGVDEQAVDAAIRAGSSVLQLSESSDGANAVTLPLSSSGLSFSLYAVNTTESGYYYISVYYTDSTVDTPTRTWVGDQLVTVKKEETTTAEPTTAEPTTAEPTTAEPTTAEPTTAEPTTAEPTTAEPTTAEPTTSEPMTEELTTEEPLPEEPDTEEPITEEVENWIYVGTNTAATYSVPDSGIYSTSSNAANENNCYTLTKNGVKYTVQNTSGQYMNVDAYGNVTWTANAQNLTLISDANSNITAYGTGNAANSVLSGVKLYSVSTEEKTGTGGYLYTLDTDGVDYGEPYLIVAPTSNHILYNNGGNTTDYTNFSITDNNTITLAANTYDWVFTVKDDTKTPPDCLAYDGSNYLYVRSSYISMSTSTSYRVRISNTGDGYYQVFRKSNTNYYSIRYSNGWTAANNGKLLTEHSSTDYLVRLFKYTGTVPGGTYFEYTSGAQFTATAGSGKATDHYVSFTDREVSIAEGGTSTAAEEVIREGSSVLKFAENSKGTGAVAVALNEEDLSFDFAGIDVSVVGTYSVPVYYTDSTADTPTATLIGTQTVSVHAAPVSGIGNGKSDTDTSLGVKAVFDVHSATNDGRVATDKSVNYESGDEFNVKLSTMSQSYSVENITNTVTDNRVHADVVFVLDLSYSMVQYNMADSSTTRAQGLCDAVNEAIDKLMSNDPETRVGVVTYGSNYWSTGIRLPLDKYSLPNAGDTTYFGFANKRTTTQIDIPDGDLVQSAILVSGEYRYIYLDGSGVSAENDTTKARVYVDTTGAYKFYSANSTSASATGTLSDNSYFVTSDNSYALVRTGNKYTIYNNFSIGVEKTGTLGTATNSFQNANVNGTTYYYRRYSTTSSTNYSVYVNTTNSTTGATRINSGSSATINGVKFTNNSRTITYSYTSSDVKTTKITVAATTAGTTDTFYSSSLIQKSDGSTLGEMSQKTSSSASEDLGGTFTQAGLKAAEEMFLEINDGTEDERVPVIVLVTDGVPTYYDTNYTNPTKANRQGNGSSASTTAQMGYLTIRTAMSVKEQVDAHYTSQDALFYSLGPGVTSTFGKTVLDPSEDNLKECETDTTTGADGLTVTAASLRTYILNNMSESELDYVDFCDWSIAGNLSSEDLSGGFETIIKNISQISRPVTTTTVTTESGTAFAEGEYLVFRDTLGDGMELRGVPVIEYNDVVYTSVKNGNFYDFTGTVIEISTEEQHDLSKTRVFTIQDGNGKTTVYWLVPSELIPVVLRKSKIVDGVVTETFTDVSPVTLSFTVGVNDVENQIGTFYSNDTDSITTATFVPQIGNPYYYNIVEDGNGNKTAVWKHTDGQIESLLKTNEQVALAYDYVYNATTDDTALTEGNQVDVLLGNNGEIELLSTNVTVTKNWDDNSDAQDMRPDKINLQLYRNGEEYGDVITVNKTDCIVNSQTNTWTWTSGELPLGTGSYYSVKEVNVPTGYSVEYFGDTVLTNTFSMRLTPDSVVVDYGLWVTVHALANDINLPDDAVISAIGTNVSEGTVLYSGVYSASRLTDGGTEVRNNGTGSYTASTNGRTVSFHLRDMQLTNSVDIIYEININGKYLYSTLTVIPAQNIYYEESFISFINGQNGLKWSTPTDVNAVSALQAEDRPGKDTGLKYDADNVYGYENNYSADTATYSMGTARVTTVTKGSFNKEAKARFTFYGTGFDLFSLTDENCGCAWIQIKNNSTNKTVTRIVDSYYGYSYGRLYADADGEPTFDSNGTVLYQSPVKNGVRLSPTYIKTAASGDVVVTDPYYFSTNSTDTKLVTTTDTTYYATSSTKENPVYTTTATYYDADGNITTAVTDEPAYAYAYAYAYGWLANSDANDALYQVPVLRERGLAYGSYTVTVIPRYSATFDEDGDGQFDFYVDGVRIYDPCGTADDIKAENKTVVEDAYKADDEWDAQYIELRKNIINATDSFFTSASIDGNAEAQYALYIDGFSALNSYSSDEDSDAMEKYEYAGPNNELYLSKNQAVTFKLVVQDSAFREITSLQLGMKVVHEGDDNANGEITIISNTPRNMIETNTIIVNGSALMFRDLTNYVGWVKTATGWETSIPLVMINTSDTVISLTDVKWGYDSDVVTAAPTPKMTFAIGRDAVSYTVDALNTYVFCEPDEIDLTEITAVWDSTDFKVGAEATLTVTTPDDIVKLQVGEIEITDFIQNDNGTRTWTYTVTVTENGDDTFNIIFTDEHGDVSETYTTDPIVIDEEETTVVDEEETTQTDENETSKDTNPVKEISRYLNMLIKILEMIKELFAKITGGWK